MGILRSEFSKEKGETMNILIQAFSCDPDRGGEFAVSWGWIKQLDRQLKKGDIIYVATRRGNIKKIENEHLEHVKILQVRYPKILYSIFKESSFMFLFWQYYAYKAAKKLKIRFNIIHVYSLSDFRRIGFWYRFKDSYTILGPVGGYQMCSKSLLDYDEKQWKRNLVNLYCKYSPIYRSKVEKYSKVYACNPETLSVLPGAELLPDVPLNTNFQNLPLEYKIHKKITLLFCGRLIKKKGVLLLLDVIEQIPEKYNFELLIYGEGTIKKQIQEIIINKKLDNKVYLKDAVSYTRISEVYRNADIFVFPSLRESGGSVLIEAMAHGLPIVGLKKSLGRLLNEHNTGLFIETNDTKENIVENYKNAIIKLMVDPKLRERMGRNGYNYVNEKFIWNVMFKRVYGDILSEM